MNMKIRSQYGYKIDKEVPKNAVRYNGYAVAVTFDAQKELDQYKPFGVYENLFRTVSRRQAAYPENRRLNRSDMRSGAEEAAQNRLRAKPDTVRMTALPAAVRRTAAADTTGFLRTADHIRQSYPGVLL